MMRAMVLENPGTELRLVEASLPAPKDHQVVIKVQACAVCRTDLHLVDGELPDIRYPVIPGHQVVGEITAVGGRAELAVGARVGVAWLGWTCGECEYCASDRENLCDRARFNGYQVDGGYAEYMLADSRYCFSLDSSEPSEQIAPLLCGGLIGYRCLRLTGDAKKVGIYGFGSAAHLITQAAIHQGREIYAFTRPGDTAAAGFAGELGAAWVGGSNQAAPEPLDAAIIFAPVGALVPKALKDLKKGGMVICGGIHMSDIPGFPYADLWGERGIRSVANLTRRDGNEFLKLARDANITAQIQTYALEDANAALAALRTGAITGTAVLVID
jgi:propanol-preferring alcohol dehydrogenase